MKSKSGFTLAEVLITLGIIGVVAAMTIPTLMNKTNNAEFVSGFKKALSGLNGALSLMANDNGGELSGAYSTVDESIDGLCAKMRCTRVCHVADTQNCGHNTDWKTFDGRAAWQDYSSNTASAILSDGMTVTMSAWWTNCNSARYKNEACGTAIIDANGAKKPNVQGRDIFEVFISKEGKIVPQGSQGTDMETYLNTDCDASATSGYNGATCGARIMIDGGMKY